MAKDKKDKKNPLDEAKKAKAAKEQKADKGTSTVKKSKGLADPSSGDQFKMADHLGQLILVDPQEFETDFQTENGPADIIRGDVTVLTEDDAKTPLKEPEEFKNTILFGRAVVGALRSQVGSGQLVIGVVGQGVKKAGKNAPWLLEAATDKQKKIALAYLG